MVHAKIAPLALLFCVLAAACSTPAPDDTPRRTEILFLGHNSKHHDSETLAGIFMQEYFSKGVNITYTVDLNDLNPENLALFDGLLVYANHDSISPAQEKALLDYVNGGGGFIPLHSASGCFRNSPKVIDLIGGQFFSHKSDSFSTPAVMPDHPVMRRIREFTTWDETYVHANISPHITVLAERVEGDHREPYTWVREYGKGRVFYTAYGHDIRTHTNQGFLDLVFSGIIWAVGEHVSDLRERFVAAVQEYGSATVPDFRPDGSPYPYQLPLSPDSSISLMQVPPGFEVRLFAAEPDIAKPVAMAWDERGRLWIAETVDYPNTVPGDSLAGRDRIKICEDTDGDGRADRFTVFADSLNIPTGMMFLNGGLLVAQAPHFLFLKDTDGDDRADVREVFMTGWGTFDTHAGPSNLKYGPDNQIWGVTGYAGFEGEVGGEYHNFGRFGQSLYRIRRDGSKMEVLGTTSNNTWGLGFTEEFDVFISTANNEHSAHFGIPSRLLKRDGLTTERSFAKIDSHYPIHPLTKHLRQVDVQGGFTAATGHNFYTARTYPSSYWNRVAFIGEPTGRLIHRHIVEPHGSGFKEANDGWNFMASSDDWVGPVHIEVGPDGQVWFLDWYNFIIQHNPPEPSIEAGPGNAYDDPLRDQTRGRVYRVVHKNGAPSKMFDLSGGNKRQLLAALQSDNMFWRTTAQRLIVESGDRSWAADLRKIAASKRLDDAGINPQAIHALWALHGLGLLDGSDPASTQAAVDALRHPAGGVRRAAAQVLSGNPDVNRHLLESGVLHDPDLRVRLAAMLTLGESDPSEEAGKALFAATTDSLNLSDRWIPRAVFIGAKPHHAGFMQGLSEHGPSASEPAHTLQQQVAMRNQLILLPLIKWNELGPDLAPEITGREIRFETGLSLYANSHTHGVVLAQGDQKNGYSVFLTPDMTLHFEVYQGGKRTKITSPTPPKSMNFKLLARLQRNGKLSLQVDGGHVYTAQAAGLFTEPFEQGLRAGFDDLEKYRPAGGYESIRVGANLDNAVLELRLADGLAEEAEALDVPVDQRVLLKTVEHVMRFDQEELSVKAGSMVEIRFENNDVMEHNLLILAQGSMEKVGAAADELARDPRAADRSYVPDMPEVLHHTPIVRAGESAVLRFRAPDTPGDYPYVCTYPGHWRIMNGMMRVSR